MSEPFQFSPFQNAANVFIFCCCFPYFVSHSLVMGKFPSVVEILLLYSPKTVQTSNCPGEELGFAKTSPTAKTLFWEMFNKWGS